MENEESIAVFLADALETGDAAYIAKAMGVIARAKGMTELSRETGLSREQLYRSFSEQGNPTLWQGKIIDFAGYLKNKLASGRFSGPGF